MEFKCKIVPFDKFLIGPNGVVPPLCNSCLQTECTNPIRSKTVSFLGVNSQWRLWVLNNSCHQVIDCAGYVDPKLELDDNEDV